MLGKAHSATFLHKMEVHVNRFQLSPGARLLVSLTLVIGILVAGRTHPLAPKAAQAQTESEEVTVPSFISAGTVLQFKSGEVVGRVISAYGVSINGAPADFVLGGNVQVLDGFIITDNLTSINGVGISGEDEPEPKDGVGISGEEVPAPKDGVGISGEVRMAHVVISGESGVQVTGGELLGHNISVVDGVVSGSNLRIVGGMVSGAGLSVSGAVKAKPGS